MRRRLLVAVSFGVLLVGALWFRTGSRSSEEALFEPAHSPPQLPPMCPWRDPGADLPKLFPEGSRFEVQTRILSGLRPELALRLGRAPGPEENALQVFEIYGGGRRVGEVVTRRVKGTFGAIEIVVAADNSRKIKGILLQRMREPQSVVDTLAALDWARWLGGKSPETAWDCDALMASLPAEARASARAIVEGAHSSLVLLAMSGQAPQANVVQTHTH